MSEATAALLPIFVLWAVPLIPLIYIGIVSAIEAIRTSPRAWRTTRPALSFKPRTEIDRETS